MLFTEVSKMSLHAERSEALEITLQMIEVTAREWNFVQHDSAFRCAAKMHDEHQFSAIMPAAPVPWHAVQRAS